MSSHVKRRVTANVVNASPSYAPKVYYCARCKEATKIEHVVAADDFNVIDPTGEVKLVTMYKIKCKVGSPVAVNFDRPGNINTNAFGPCYGGTEEPHTESCASCVFGSEKIVRIDTDKKLHGKTKVKALKGCKIYRTLYKCRHQSRSIYTDGGGYMCSYIKCQYYKPK